MSNNNTCTLTAVNDGIAVKTPFDRDFVDDLKYLIPSSGRRWNDKTKDPANVWVVAPDYADVVERLIDEHFNESVKAPSFKAKGHAYHVDTIKVKYIGSCKEKNGNAAFGMDYTTGEWRYLFPEQVLKSWFSGHPIEDIRPTVRTLFDILGVRPGSTVEEIKQGFRRMARQWHPDVCKEPDAHERFVEIQEAYATLSDDRQRARYEFGLKQVAGLEAPKSKKSPRYANNEDYKPDLRCGLITCEYEEILGRYQIKKILKWEDITNGRGEILVTSWAMGNDKPTEEWVDPNRVF